MQLSQKQKSILNLQHFQKEEDSPSWSISEIVDSKKRD